MQTRLIALVVYISLLLFPNQLLADVNVLIIGSTRDSGEVLAINRPNSSPFVPAEIGAQLQNILAQDGRGNVNVSVTERYAYQWMAPVGQHAFSYTLASWFHYPFPAGAPATRWANLRGEAGTVWDYIVLIEDPYTMEYTPGLYAQGVAKIAEEVAKGPAQLVLLMPWQGAGSSSSVNHYKEVVYRTGRSGGHKVAPAALAWQACGSPTSASHPSTAGAYIAAASIYSTIYNQSASNSGYTYNDTHADTAFATFTNNNTATQYTGPYSFQSPYKILDDKRRDVHTSERGTSTEGFFKGAITSAMSRSMVTYVNSPYDDNYNSNTPADDGYGWPTANPMPIAFNYGRDGIISEPYKSYVVNPDYWQAGFGYYYHSDLSTDPLLNDYHIGLMQVNDNDLANRMLSQGSTARNIPIRTLWAQIRKEYPSAWVFRDGLGHLSDGLNDAVGNYIYTIYSGRCPLDPKPATDDFGWNCRRIGYETAWRMGRCQSRAPGFKVNPSAATKKSIIPGESETMSVRFIFPPKQDVRVTASISNANAAIVGSKDFIFTPQNYHVPQNVTVTGLPGSAASENFTVDFATTSTDEVYSGINDSWQYQIIRSVPTSLTRVDKGITQVTAYQNLPVTINLNTAGASSANTVLAGPSRGTVSWSGSDIIYTPSSDFTDKDGFSFATDLAGTLSVGYVEITVTTAVPNGLVSYRGNGSDSGTVPLDANTYAQNNTVTVLGNTGNLFKSGHNFDGWNTAADGSGTTYVAGAPFTMGANGMILYAKWRSVPTYTVTYSGNSPTSGSAPFNQIKTDGISLTLAANIGSLAKTGYAFSGWNTAANGSGTTYAASSDYNLNANLTLYARWTANTFTVTFDPAGGTTPDPTSKTVTYNSTYGTFPTTSRDGYQFKGWFTDPRYGYGGQILPTHVVNLSADLTLYAQWTPLYPVAYHANGANSGTAPPTQTKTHDVSLTLASNSGSLGRSGYIFSAWNTAADGSGTTYAAAATYTANAPVTLYAQWAGASTYSVSYDGNGQTSGSTPSSQTKTQGLALTLATNSGNLFKTGYTFIGWNDASDGSGTHYPTGAFYTADAPIVLYARWSPGYDGTWLPTTAGPFDWGAAGNWSGGYIPAHADRTASFITNLIASQVVNLESARTVGHITFTDSTTPSADLTISGSNYLNLDTTTGIPTIHVTQSGRILTISSAISGIDGLYKTGPGTLALSGTNIYSGGTVVDAGVITVQNNNAFGTGAITVTGNCTINTTHSAFPQMANALHLNGGVTLTTPGSNQYYGMTFTGPVSGSGTIQTESAGNNSNVRHKLGLYNSVNTFTGTLVNKGIHIICVNSLGDGGKIQLTNGTFALGAGTASPLLFNTRQVELLGSGVISNTNASTSNTITINTNLAFASTGAMTLTLSGGNAGNNAFNGNITDNDVSAVSVTKADAGVWSLSGTNSYTGSTTVSAGKLFIHGDQSLATAAVSVAANATLGGIGTIGGHTTIAANGKLEFDISTNPANHNKLELATGKMLALSGASTLVITSTGGASVGTYTLLTAPGGISGVAPATLVLPGGWLATTEIVGNDLILNISSLGTLAVTPAGNVTSSGLQGGPFTPSSQNYTLENTGSTTLNWTAAKAASWVTLSATGGSLAPGATTTVTATINSNANALAAGNYSDTVTFTNTSSANNSLIRGVNLTVNAPGSLSVLGTGGLTSSGTYGGVFSPSSLQYTLSNPGTTAINWTASKTAAWVNLSSASGTLAAGTSTTVIVSINGNANALNIGSYSDTVTFTNTTNADGNTTRAVALAVNATPATITLGNLAQTYDGSQRSVSVTTNPASLAHSITYDGSSTAPINAGTYAVVATISDSSYTGSSSGSLIIAKAAQSIAFGTLASRSDAAAPFALGATASSGLTVSYTSSNSSVATVSGNTVTIVGVGSTTITASQAGGANYEAATSVPQTLTVLNSNPIADPGGPYTVFSNQPLTLVGGGSVPSYGETLTSYSWDLNNDNTFGDATGASPAAISYTALTTTWGMVQGMNTIQLRVTDSAGKTSTISTTVSILVGLIWDANAGTAGQADGSGAWMDASKWWNGSTNVNWSSGSSAIFGNGGVGGTVTLAGSTIVNSLIFSSYTTTNYTVGTSGNTITLNAGITKHSGGIDATIVGPIDLGGAQTWTNNSASNLTSTGRLTIGGYRLTIGGSGNTTLGGNINGSGGLTKDSSSTLILSSGVSSFTGSTFINAGTLSLNLADSPAFASPTTVNPGGTLRYSPTNHCNIASTAATVNLQGAIVYNTAGNLYQVIGAAVTANATSTIDLTSVGITSAGLYFDGGLKGSSNVTVSSNTNGLGLVLRNTASTYSGTLTVNGSASIISGTGSGLAIGPTGTSLSSASLIVNGTLELGNHASGMGWALGAVTATTVNIDALNGSGVVVANMSTASSTRILSVGNNNGAGNFSGVLANGANNTLSFIKAGTGTQILSGSNIYTGTTTVSLGKLFINGNQNSASGAVSVAANATLGGTGIIGGNTTIAASGKLEFDISTSPASHNKLELATGKSLAFSGASTLSITSSGEAGAGAYTLLTAPGGISGVAPATLILPSGWVATVSIVGNDLILNVTSVPSNAVDHFEISSIASPQTVGTAISGITITAKTASNQTATNFTGTVSFGGTAGVTGTSGNFAAGVLTGVSVTPTQVGTGLTLTVNDGASHTGSTTFDVQSAFSGWSSGAVFGADANGDGVSNGMAWLLGAANSSASTTTLMPNFDTSDITYHIYTFRRSDAAYAAAGATIAMEYSSTLGAWTAAVHDGANIIITPTNDYYGTGVDKVEVKIKKTFVPSDKLFCRIKFAYAP